MELLKAAEDEEDPEREDLPGLTDEARLPAPGREDDGAQGQARRRAAAEAAAEELEGAAGEAQARPKDGPPQGAETGPPREDGADGIRRRARAERLGRAAEAVRQAGAGDVLGLPTADSTAAMAGAGAGTGPAGDDRTGPAGGAGTGLEKLYRQTAKAARPPAPAPAPGQAGRGVRSVEIEGAAYSAVDELDRAVRRDSRRYDGGMTIF